MHIDLYKDVYYIVCLVTISGVQGCTHLCKNQFPIVHVIDSGVYSSSLDQLVLNGG